MNTKTTNKAHEHTDATSDNTRTEKGVTNSEPRKLNEIFYLSKPKTSKGGKTYYTVARTLRKDNDTLEFKWDNDLVAFPTKSGGFMICERVESDE